MSIEETLQHFVDQGYRPELVYDDGWILVLYKGGRPELAKYADTVPKVISKMQKALAKLGTEAK